MPKVTAKKSEKGGDRQKEHADIHTIYHSETQATRRAKAKHLLAALRSLRHAAAMTMNCTLSIIIYTKLPQKQKVR